jgi:hypothetical protein
VATTVHQAEPRAILIVDGEFGQSLSVWHKEILNALHLGIRVIGASSMGALRAAELHRSGMEGVGEIYAYYRDSWLTSDADVALVYSDAAEGYEPLSWPLVNVRATASALVAAGRISSQDANLIVDAAGKVHFTHRRREALAGQLTRDGSNPARAAELAALVAEHYVDQKAADAVAAFEYLARIDEIPRPPREEPTHRDGRGFQPLLWSDVTIARRSGSLRRYQLVDDVALHEPEFEALLERAVNRYLIGYIARDIGIEITEDELAQQRARMLRRLELTEETLPRWLAANQLDAAAFDGLMGHEAVNVRMRCWLLDTRLYERNRRLVIEQLQLEGRYAPAADAAARRRAMADSQPQPPYRPARRHWSTCSCARPRSATGAPRATWRGWRTSRASTPLAGCWWPYPIRPWPALSSSAAAECPSCWDGTTTGPPVPLARSRPRPPAPTRSSKPIRSPRSC